MKAAFRRVLSHPRSPGRDVVWIYIGIKRVARAQMSPAAARKHATPIPAPARMYALKKMEYGRGYSEGIQFHFNNQHSTSPPDTYSIANIARRNGSRDVHSYARGYRDGYKGMKPEYAG